MKRIFPVAALALAALVLGACDKSGTNSAYNNSGASATPMMPADPPSQAASTPPVATASEGVTTATATSDTTSPAAPPVSAVSK